MTAQENKNAQESIITKEEVKQVRFAVPAGICEWQGQKNAVVDTARKHYYAEKIRLQEQKNILQAKKEKLEARKAKEQDSEKLDKIILSLNATGTALNDTKKALQYFDNFIFELSPIDKQKIALLVNKNNNYYISCISDDMQEKYLYELMRFYSCVEACADYLLLFSDEKQAAETQAYKDLLATAKKASKTCCTTLTGKKDSENKSKVFAINADGLKFLIHGFYTLKTERKNTVFSIDNESKKVLKGMTMPVFKRNFENIIAQTLEKVPFEIKAQEIKKEKTAANESTTKPKKKKTTKKTDKQGE